MEEGGEGAGLDYGQLLEQVREGGDEQEDFVLQVQNLQDLQKNGALQAADPDVQAAYIQKLQHQAASIKSLLALLQAGVPPNGQAHRHSRGSSPGCHRGSSPGGLRVSSPGSMLRSTDSSQQLREEVSLYEPLWEAAASSSLYGVEEVEEEEEEAERSVYENTGVAVSDATVGVGE